MEGGGRPELIANGVSRKIGNRQVGARGCVEGVKGPKVGQRRRVGDEDCRNGRGEQGGGGGGGVEEMSFLR